MRAISYKLLRETLYHFEIKHEELATALGMSPTSLSARMTGKMPWSQDEMYMVSSYINSVAKSEGEPAPLPHDRLYEYFPPRSPARERIGVMKGSAAV